MIKKKEVAMLSGREIVMDSAASFFVGNEELRTGAFGVGNEVEKV